MSQGFKEDTACVPTKELFSRFGGKWSVGIVAALDDRTLRFSQLRTELGGISQKVLTLALRALERDGFVCRTVYPTVPPRVDYALSALGREVTPLVKALGSWAEANRGRTVAARVAFDAHDE